MFLVAKMIYRRTSELRLVGVESIAAALGGRKCSDSTTDEEELGSNEADRVPRLSSTASRFCCR